MQFLRHAVVTVLLLGMAAAVLGVLYAGRGGLVANREPGWLERSVASRLVRLSIPSDADRQQNPFTGNRDAWRGARDHYLDHCAVCHGRDAKGNTEVGQNMYPKVPDLTSQAVQARTDGALFYIIQNGVRWTGMPAWKGEHSPEDTWKLVSFIRKTPTLTEADVKKEEPGASTADEHAPGEHRHRHPH